MKEWFCLLEHIDSYVYDHDSEELIIEDTEARQIYDRIIIEYHLAPEKYYFNSIKWEFDIALDCVRQLSQEKRDFINDNFTGVFYHDGYLMYVRNHYIHCAKKHEVLMPDDCSSQIFSFIRSIIHPYYDFRNHTLSALLHDEEFEKLCKTYRDRYGELIRVTIENAALPGYSLTPKQTCEELYKRICKISVPSDFKEAFISLGTRYNAANRYHFFGDYWISFLSEFEGQVKNFPVHFNQLKSLAALGYFHRILSEYETEKRPQSIDECKQLAIDLLGLREDDAQLMAECAWGLHDVMFKKQ